MRRGVVDGRQPHLEDGGPEVGLHRVGVPSAMTRPWSMTASVLASRSASSRYWVVRSTVVPPPTRLLDDLPQVVAALGVEPGGRLVEEEHGGPGHQGGGQVEPPAHAARVGLERAVAGVGQVELAEQLDGPAGRRTERSRWLRLPTIWRFSRPVRFSSTAAYWPARPIRRADQCRPSSARRGRAPGPCRRRPQDGGEDPDGGGLARAVGSEQAEHRSLLDGEADPVEGADLVLAR